MELTNDFEVKDVEGKIELFQVVKRTLSYAEAMQELNKLKNEFAQLDGQAKSTEQAILTNQLEEKLKALLETKTKIGVLIEDLEKASEPHLNELRDTLRARVKVAKADVGYSRMTKKNPELKVVKQNEIIAPIVVEMDLDMSHPLVMEVKRDFESL